MAFLFLLLIELVIIGAVLRAILRFLNPKQRPDAVALWIDVLNIARMGKKTPLS